MHFILFAGVADIQFGFTIAYATGGTKAVADAVTFAGVAVGSLTAAGVESRRRLARRGDQLRRQAYCLRDRSGLAGSLSQPFRPIYWYR